MEGVNETELRKSMFWIAIFTNGAFSLFAIGIVALITTNFTNLGGIFIILSGLATLGFLGNRIY